VQELDMVATEEGVCSIFHIEGKQLHKESLLQLLHTFCLKNIQLLQLWKIIASNNKNVII